MSDIQLTAACIRIKCLTVQEVSLHQKLLCDTLESLRKVLVTYFKNGSTFVNQESATTGHSLAAPKRIINVTSKYIDIAPALTTGPKALPLPKHIDVLNKRGNLLPTAAVPIPRSLRNTEIGTQPTSTTSQTADKLPRYKRAFKNAQSNAKVWSKKSKGVQVTVAFTERVAEFPPAKAAADVSKPRKSQSVVVNLEGFFGAMLITNEYGVFKGPGKGSTGKGSPGKGSPRGRRKEVYPQFAKHRGISAIDSLPSIVKFGTLLLSIWAKFPSQLGIVLLVDQLPTLRSMSIQDVERLKVLVDGDKNVSRLASSLNASVADAKEGYQKISDKLWSPEEIGATIASIKKLIEPGENELEDVDKDGSRNDSEDIEFEGCDTATNNTRVPPSKRRRLDESDGTSTENPLIEMNDLPGPQNPGYVLTSRVNLGGFSVEVRPTLTNGTVAVDQTSMHAIDDEYVQNDGHIPPSPGSASAPSEPLLGNTGDDTHTAAIDTGRDWEAEFNSLTEQELIFGGMAFCEWDDGGMEFLNVEGNSTGFLDET